MTVRLGFAVAAHLEPEILVVDEVLAVGDAEFQKKAIGKMQDVSREDGRTVLFVSHNIAAIKALCSHGILLKNGTIDFKGTTLDTINRYARIDKEIVVNDIVKCAIYNSGKVLVSEVLINNSNNNFVKIGETNDFFEVKISGEVRVDLFLSMEMKIFDQNDIAVFFYAPDLIKGSKKIFKKGRFEIKCSIKLPIGLTKGDYYADVYLTNPMIEGYVAFYRAILIESEGYSTSSGFVFEYAKGHGWLILD
jgi:lipopolysaccharide transport system ATP-binding protein